MNAMMTLRYVLSFFFILVLAYYSIRLLGKRVPSAQGRSRVLRVVSAHPLGQNKTLQVVVFDEKTVLLLGVGSDVSCVARFDDEELVARLTRTQRESQIVEPAFSWMRNRLQKNRALSDEAAFSELLSKRIDGMKQYRSQHSD
ncbi:FliO/MopB family protein [Ferroacidibacillus organovorans]|uniref:Flagellar protein n=1 Tax=Ferroacidibacillus organovorans TaxID=1765683 RepID=A0A1V4ERV3_9BACL|nr:flagellar biosynthetic protein FliO [Ferroacidibacillus organovorans]OPG15666.1 hypothetical protein B2M26_11470 [Ferroacidibacillus organovorans]